MLDNCNFEDIVYYRRTTVRDNNFHLHITKGGFMHFSKKFMIEYEKEIAGNNFIKIGYSKKNHAIVMHLVSNDNFSDCSVLILKAYKGSIAVSTPSCFRVMGLVVDEIKGYYNVTYERTQNFGNFFVLRLTPEVLPAVVPESAQVEADEDDEPDEHEAPQKVAVNMKIGGIKIKKSAALAEENRKKYVDVTKEQIQHAVKTTMKKLKGEKDDSIKVGRGIIAQKRAARKG